ncbi:DNA-(apurinic or apyrimidinic site) lyase isoform X2 [Agrilus planipennis]|uniref:DNA-(apurinic or apyrimidinic site) endonuclease n=1 Tax=Agrilus planipennis TaxID=224129 RepID=A0A1W4WV08_AGRPL|nr:DNA-(apurinic or apyrimidinic site) lyase isoform X2 [Agrilus planipennis]
MFYGAHFARFRYITYSFRWNYVDCRRRIKYWDKKPRSRFSDRRRYSTGVLVWKKTSEHNYNPYQRSLFFDVCNFVKRTMPPKRKAGAAKSKDEPASAVIDEKAGGDTPVEFEEDVKNSNQKAPSKKAVGKGKETKADLPQQSRRGRAAKGNNSNEVEIVEPVENERPKRKGQTKKPIEEAQDLEVDQKPRRGRAKDNKQNEKDEPEENIVDSGKSASKTKKKQANAKDSAEPPQKQQKTLKKRGPVAKKVEEEKEKDDDDEEEEEDDDEKQTIEPVKKGSKNVKKQPPKETEETEVPEKGKKGARGQKNGTAVKKQESQEAPSELSEPTIKRKKGNEAAPKNEKKEKAPLKNKTDSSFGDIDFDCTRKAPSGQEWNIKIASWNVDGLRAWCKKDGIKYVEHEKPDILCLQETKCSSEQLPEDISNLDEYNYKYWQSSNEKGGYAGVGVLSKTEPLSVSYGINNESHDEEGRCITTEYEKFYLVCVYVPNAGRKLVTLPKRLEWNESFKNYIKDLDKKKPVIICGDMNVAHNEIDIANPKSNTKNAGFTKEEREGMTDFLGEGFVDTYRELYPDNEGAYTFWTYMTNARSKNVGWRLDYFIVSSRFMENVCDNIIRNEVYGSDHCPITLFIAV